MADSPQRRRHPFLTVAAIIAGLFLVIYVSQHWDRCAGGKPEPTSPTKSTAQTAAAAPTTEPETAPPLPTAADVAFNPDNGTTFSYVNLGSARRREIYRAMEAVCQNVTDDTEEDLYKTASLPLSFRLDDNGDEDFTMAYNAFTNDNPWAFWPVGGRYINHSDYSEMYLVSEVSPSALAEMRAALDGEVSRFLSGVPSGSDYEKEKYAHDYVIEHCSYNQEFYDAPDQDAKDSLGTANPQVYTAYGALCNGDAVCCGYTRAFQRLCDRMHIDCAFLVGTGSVPDGGDEYHNWNAVRLDGEWYMVDVTWDDKPDTAFRYRYFNVDADRIAADHAAGVVSGDKDDYNARVENFFLPACHATRYCYYLCDAECTHITDITGTQIAQAIVSRLRQGSREVTLYLDPQYISYDAAISAIFDGDGYMNRYMEYMYDNSPYGYTHYHYWTLPDRSALVIRMEE